MEGFRFALGQRAMLRTSRHSGRIIGRAEYISGNRAYLMELDQRVAGKSEYWYKETEVTEEE